MSQPKSIVSVPGRLLLTAATLAHVRAELAAPQRLADLLGAAPPADWPPGQYDRDAQEFFCQRLAEGGAAAVGWWGWYAVRQAQPGRPALLVGAAGFLGPPDPAGQVEMGFSVAADCRGQGYASEMTTALVGHALADRRVRLVVAHTAPGNHASRRVLQKCGFGLAGPGDEPDTLRFELGPAAAGGGPSSL